MTPLAIEKLVATPEEKAHIIKAETLEGQTETDLETFVGRALRRLHVSKYYTIYDKMVADHGEAYTASRQKLLNMDDVFAWLGDNDEQIAMRKHFKDMVDAFITDMDEPMTLGQIRVKLGLA